MSKESEKTLKGHDCRRIDELMSQFGLSDIDELKHMLEDAERWRREIAPLELEGRVEKLQKRVQALERALAGGL